MRCLIAFLFLWASPLGAFVVHKRPRVSVRRSAAAANDDSDADRLIALAKDILYNKSGFYSEYDEDIFAEDFVVSSITMDSHVPSIQSIDRLVIASAFWISPSLLASLLLYTVPWTHCRTSQ
jgi:hypothetical protein